MENQEQTINIARPSTASPKVEIPMEVRAAFDGGKTNKTVEKIKYPSEPIGLPSEGYFYPEESPLSSGIVDIKLMTAKEEDILTSQNLIKKGIVLERLLESLIVTPGVKITELLIGDKNALFMAARRLAYGNDYGPVEITCKSCSEDNKKHIDLSTIVNKPFDFSNYTKGQNSFNFTLPHSNRTITFKLLTHKDEAAIDAELSSLSKITKGATSPEITTRLKHMITSVDGNIEKSFINKFVDNEFAARDSLALRTYVRDNTPNIDMGFNFVCDSCSHEERMDIPLSVSFFWPSS